jgi:MFS family permease
MTTIQKLEIEQIKKELEQKQVLKIQKELLRERQKRITVISMLLSALIFTIIYGTIQNPFQYTFSKIGNRFTFQNRILFIVWASFTGFVIQSSIVALFTLENYQNKKRYIYIFLATIFLVLTAMSPSLDELIFWQWIHLVTAGLFGLFITLGFLPFISWVASENPRLRRIVYTWLIVIWGGSFLWMFILGNTGVFELWFFTLFIIFLLYLSMVLFEEKIVKRSVILLRDEENLNIGIEKIFINLERKPKNKRA